MSPCPSEEQLRQFLDSELVGDQSAAVETHVEACPACQAAMVRFCSDAPGIDWRLLRAPGPAPMPESTVDLVCRLEQIPPVDSEPDGEEDSGPIVFSGPPTDRGPLGRLDSLHIRRELGRGRFGVVYEAIDELDRQVAVKVLKPHLAADPRERARFEREARKAAAVRHDHIVAVYRVGQAEGSALPYLVMEYLEGETLAARLRRAGALPPREAAAIVRQAALGLAAAHARRLVHRDVKPSNILLEDGGVVSGGVVSGAADDHPPLTTHHSPLRAKIADFGLARATEGGSAASQSEAMVGSPAYMSPEQVAAPGKVDGRSDIYSLGVVLYEALTGVRPFRGSPHLVLQQVVHAPPRPPRRINDKIPRDLETICLKCLEKEPGKRYANAEALVDDLGQFLDDKPIQARRAGRLERSWRWCRRNPALTGALAAVLLAAVVVVLALLPPRPADPEEGYRRRASAVLDELRQGRKVELIPPHPANEDFFALRSGAKGTVVKRVRDGMGIHCQPRCGLIELLPEVPVPSYRLRVRLRRERPLTDERELGVYVKHRCAVTDQGPQHYFVAVYVSMPWQVEADAAGRLGLRGSFRPRLFGELENPADRPLRDFYWVRTGRPNHTDVEYTPDREDRSVEVEITVTPAQIAASFRPAGSAGAADLPLLTLADQDRAKNHLRGSYPDLAEADFEGSALGIYVREVVCTVQSFTVESIGD
jgi:hypothetical protein